MRTEQISPESKPERYSAARLANGLIISVSEARKILGVDAKGRSDDELMADIHELAEVAQAILKAPLSSNKI